MLTESLFIFVSKENQERSDTELREVRGMFLFKTCHYFVN